MFTHGAVWIQVMFPNNPHLAEPEHVVFFYAIHLVNDGMTDLRLQFTRKAAKNRNYDTTPFFA